MDATLNTVAGLPTYVLVFLGIIAFLYVMHKQSLASALQVQSVNNALAIAANAQTENNRLRDESNKQQERWQHMLEMMNERYMLAIGGNTTAIGQQTSRLATMDTSMSSLPTLAASAQATGQAIAGVDHKVSLGLEILKLLGVDVGDLAKHASNPTAGTQQKIDQMADKAELKAPTITPEQPAAPAAPVLSPGDKIEVTGTVTGTVSGTVAPKGETVPA